MNVRANPQIRIRFEKAGKIRFVSHRDLARIVERALRKVRLPVAYSEGFSPRPKISFGLALSVAHESNAEYFDVTLTELVAVDDLASRMSEALPDGLLATAVTVLEPGSDSLQQAIRSCTWRIEILDQTVKSISNNIRTVLGAATLPQSRIRKGKTSQVDVRPAIVDISIEGPTAGGVQLEVELSTETLTLRPDEFILTLGEDLEVGRVCRIHQWMIVDGVRCEPVKPPGPSTRRELRSAS